MCRAYRNVCNIVVGLIEEGATVAHLDIRPAYCYSYSKILYRRPHCHSSNDRPKREATTLV